MDKLTDDEKWMRQIVLDKIEHLKEYVENCTPTPDGKFDLSLLSSVSENLDNATNNWEY